MIHVRCAMKAITQEDMPQVALQSDIDEFDRRFSNEHALVKSVQVAFRNYRSFGNQAHAHVQELLREARKLHAKSHNAKIITRIQEGHLVIIFQCLAAVGLKKFAPDILGGPDSMYNLVHEYAIIYSFRQIVTMGGYAFIAPHLSVAVLAASATGYYRSFVFNRLKTLVIAEVNNPGAISESVETAKVTNRRRCLASGRAEFLVDRLFRPHTVAMVKRPEANSDDERINSVKGGPATFAVIPKRGRNSKYSIFASIIDEKRRERAVWTNRNLYVPIYSLRLLIQKCTYLYDAVMNASVFTPMFHPKQNFPPCPRKRHWTTMLSIFSTTSSPSQNATNSQRTV